MPPLYGGIQPDCHPFTVWQYKIFRFPASSIWNWQSLFSLKEPRWILDCAAIMHVLRLHVIRKRGIICGRQSRIFSVLRYRWTRSKPGKFTMEVRDARDAPILGAFPYASSIGFSRASTDSRMGIAPSSFPARETKAKRGRRSERDEENHRVRAIDCRYMRGNRRSGYQVSLLRIYIIRFMQQFAPREA